MDELDIVIRDLVVANRILAHEGVLDAYGHVSVRHPGNPQRYFLSCSRSPELVTQADIMEFALDGAPVGSDRRNPYIERFIHGAIYEARPEVQSVVHSHAMDVLPFSISATPLRPVVHSAGQLGAHIPVWDIGDRFGDTDLLVRTMAQGRDLARQLGGDRAVLMRGHGFASSGRTLPEAVRVAVYMPRNARVLLDALRLGEVKPLTRGEIELRMAMSPGGLEWSRAWEYWAMRAGCGDLLRAPPARAPKMGKKQPKARRR